MCPHSPVNAREIVMFQATTILGWHEKSNKQGSLENYS